MLYFAKWKVALVLGVVLIGALFAFPNVLPESARSALPGFLPKNAVNLGLDLQGGSHLEYDVDLAAVRRARLENLLDSSREMLAAADIALLGSEIRDGSVVLTLADETAGAAALDALEPLVEPLGAGPGAAKSVALRRDGEEIVASVTSEAIDFIRRESIDKAIEIIRRRIDSMGTTEPTIQRQAGARVVVQVPGVDDPERLKALIGKTAVMSFNLVTDDDPNLNRSLAAWTLKAEAGELADAMALDLSQFAVAEDATSASVTRCRDRIEARQAARQAEFGLDEGEVRSGDADTDELRVDRAACAAAEALRPILADQNASLIANFFPPPGIRVDGARRRSDAEIRDLVDAAVGEVLAEALRGSDGATALALADRAENLARSFRAHIHTVTDAARKGTRRATPSRTGEAPTIRFRDQFVASEDPAEPFLVVDRRTNLTGEDLSSASQGFHPQTGEPVVNFSFKPGAAREFGRLTTEHTNERFAILLDDVVISAPNIRTPILGGSGFIEGGFDVASASDLSAVLSAGALPAPLTPVLERTVGAELGQDSVEKGRLALLVGFLAVMVFMLVAYSLMGVFSNLALLANVMLIVGALSGLGATLTLPGMAGIILTIGMAVDANVLIYERIREEQALGRTIANAIEAGYSRALATILDANITTLLAAAVLFYLGSGPVQGFAVTLGIGIVTSVFTAFVFSRLLVAWWLRWARPKSLPI